MATSQKAADSVVITLPVKSQISNWSGISVHIIVDTTGQFICSTPNEQHASLICAALNDQIVGAGKHGHH